MLTKEQKEFAKKLHSISRSRSIGHVFSDWLEIAAISMHQLPYHSGELSKDEAFETLEAQYMERIKTYRKEELTIFSELVAIALCAHHNEYHDFLGEVAGEESLLSKRGGQFFTPYAICRLMTKMSFGNVRAQVEEKGILSVSEPAVGAGAMVIAAAEEVASQGIDPRACLQFDCTDVSRDAFNMAYIQLSALGLQAVVRHGNTITLEYWEHRATPQLRLFHQWLEPHRKTQRMIQAMRSILTEAEAVSAPDVPAPMIAESPSQAPAETLFDLAPFTDKSPTKKRSRNQPDVVLDRQINLFG